MRRILALSVGSPAALMRAELGLPSLGARVKVIILNFWMKHTRSNIDSLGSKSLQISLECDKVRSKFLNQIRAQYSIPDDLLGCRNDLREWIFHMHTILDNRVIAQPKVAAF